MPVLGADLTAVRGFCKIFRIRRKVAVFLTVQAACDELAVEVPDRQAEVLEVELPLMLVSYSSGSISREQVAADAIGVDQLQNVRLLLGLLGEAVASKQRRIKVFRPPQRTLIDIEVIEDLVVKAVLADKELVDLARGTCRFRHPG